MRSLTSTVRRSAPTIALAAAVIASAVGPSSPATVATAARRTNPCLGLATALALSTLGTPAKQ